HDGIERIVRPLALESGASRRAKDLLQSAVAVDEVAQREYHAVLVILEILIILIAGKDAPTAIALVVGLFAIEPADRVSLRHTPADDRQFGEGAEKALFPLALAQDDLLVAKSGANTDEVAVGVEVAEDGEAAVAPARHEGTHPRPADLDGAGSGRRGADLRHHLMVVRVRAEVRGHLPVVPLLEALDTAAQAHGLADRQIDPAPLILAGPRGPGAAGGFLRVLAPEDEVSQTIERLVVPPGSQRIDIGEHQARLVHRDVPDLIRGRNHPAGPALQPDVPPARRVRACGHALAEDRQRHVRRHAEDDGGPDALKDDLAAVGQDLAEEVDPPSGRDALRQLDEAGLGPGLRATLGEGPLD